MFSSFIQRVDSAVPAGYETPAFPSLYWPLPLSAVKPYYLYRPGDIWRFTTAWTLIFFGAVHLVVAAWACIVQWRNWKLIWMGLILYAIIGGLEGLIAGSVVGGLYVNILHDCSRCTRANVYADSGACTRLDISRCLLGYRLFGRW